MRLNFVELFEYNHHVNIKLSALFVEHDHLTSERSVKLFSHILNAHHIWKSRIEGIKPGFDVWSVHPVAEFASVNLNNYDTTLRLLDQVDFNEEIRYTTSTGKAFTNTVGDILFHIVNHSTYHRGQIASDFKDSGIEPLNTDYILFKREN
jgi:uncharacterized damage-inducible protein DinB